MGLFSRNHRDGPVTGTRSTAHHTTTSEKTRTHRGRHSRGPAVLSMTRRPSFGQWLKAVWVDILTMVIMGVIGLGVYEAPPAANRSFPVYFQDGEIVYPQFAYPLRKEIIPIWAAALLGALVPIFFFLVCQIRVRSFWDVNNATIGLLYSLITAAVFQVFLKCLIGGLRPHFLAVCKPLVPITGQKTGNGLSQIMYDRTICTGDKNDINDSLESFPSGHSTAAFAGFVFLSLYLNGKLKTFSNYHPAMWKLIATYAPILGATLIAGTLTIDEFHNWYDCFAGAVIGTVMAFSAYRMVYASIWDWRFNHIPLNRLAPFSYDGAMGGEFGMHSYWTRKAGWGGDSAYGDSSGHGTSAGYGDSPSYGNPAGNTAVEGGHMGHHNQQVVTGNNYQTGGGILGTHSHDTTGTGHNSHDIGRHHKTTSIGRKPLNTVDHGQYVHGDSIV